jgi:adenylate kinase
MTKQIQKITTWLQAGSINLFGLPFAGKDTQGRTLANLLGGALLGGGDILRSHHDPEKIKDVMSAGGLIPSDFYFSLVLPFLSQPKFKDKPLILDAVGRSQGEEPTILKATASSGHPLKAVVLLKLTEEEVWLRFDQAMLGNDRGQRTDDHREVLKNRLQKFRLKTLPVIEFYRKQGLLIEVDGSKSRAEVTNEILDKLAELA